MQAQLDWPIINLTALNLFILHRETSGISKFIHLNKLQWPLPMREIIIAVIDSINL